MIDMTYQVEKVLSELTILDDFIHYYANGDKKQMLELVDNAKTEIAKLKVYAWSEDGAHK